MSSLQSYSLNIGYSFKALFCSLRKESVLSRILARRPRFSGTFLAKAMPSRPGSLLLGGCGLHLVLLTMSVREDGKLW